MRKKLISALVLIVLLLGMSRSGNVYADEKEIEIVDGLVVDEDTAVPLYNYKEDITAYYIKGNDKGYVILDNAGDVIEFSYQDSIDDIEASDTDCYYGGPGNYYVEEKIDSNVLINISTDEKLEKDKIEDFETDEDTIIVNRGTDAITLPDGIKYSDGKTTYTDKIYKTLTFKSKSTLPYHSRYFDYNDNNTCGSTAAAIFT